MDGSGLDLKCCQTGLPICCPAVHTDSCQLAALHVRSLLEYHSVKFDFAQDNGILVSNQLYLQLH